MEVDQLSEIDWNFLFDNVPPRPLEQESTAITPNQTVESWIEELLMKDDDEQQQQQQQLDSALENDFMWSDLLIDSPKIDCQPSDDDKLNSNSISCSNSEEDNVNITTTTNYGYVNNNNNNNVISNDRSSNDNDGEQGVNDEKSENDIEADDDPISKKRKRQLRNRDAALRSRERKKIYVKDLEVKSQYMEAEVRRLGRLLQCCYAENQMLRISLGSAYGASMAKPESAVLLLESLLLVSLVWLMVNICLLPLPKLPLLNQCAAPHESVERKKLGSAALNRKGTKVSELSVTFSFMRSKRCQASRIKMKSEYDRAVLCV